MSEHIFNDEFAGIGGSFVVVDGKRVPAEAVPIKPEQSAPADEFIDTEKE